VRSKGWWLDLGPDAITALFLPPIARGGRGRFTDRFDRSTSQLSPRTGRQMDRPRHPQDIDIHLPNLSLHSATMPPISIDPTLSASEIANALHIENPEDTDRLQYGDVVESWDFTFRWDQDCKPASELERSVGLIIVVVVLRAGLGCDVPDVPADRFTLLSVLVLDGGKSQTPSWTITYSPSLPPFSLLRKINSRSSSPKPHHHHHRPLKMQPPERCWTTSPRSRRKG
jgi:hypothetical protein